MTSVKLPKEVNSVIIYLPGMWSLTTSRPKRNSRNRTHFEIQHFFSFFLENTFCPHFFFFIQPSAIISISNKTSASSPTAEYAGSWVYSYLQMDNFNSIPGTTGHAENSSISSHQGFALLSIAPWREGKTRERGFPMTLHRWMNVSMVNIGSALKQGVLQWLLCFIPTSEFHCGLQCVGGL